MYTDAGFVYGTHKTINAFLRNNMNVYQYMLTYQGEHSFTEYFSIPPVGVCHADDLIYLWEPVFGWDQGEHVLQGEDDMVRSFMTRIWSLFSMFGDPTPPDVGEIGVTWLPRTEDNMLMLNISGQNPEMVNNDEMKKRMEFWSTLMFR